MIENVTELKLAIERVNELDRLLGSASVGFSRSFIEQREEEYLDLQRQIAAYIESLRRQIERIKSEIARAEDEPLLSKTSAAFLGLPFEDNQAEEKQREIDELREVLATLEGLVDLAY